MMRRERVHVDVDDATIAEGDVARIIEPVTWLTTIYDGPGIYEESFKRFSSSQRLVKALLLYIYEVTNGGHKQFFSNSSGIVWGDAIEGFRAIGVPEGAQILLLSAQRLGGQPSLDRAELQEQLVAYGPDFDDVDESLNSLQSRIDLNERILSYVRAHPTDFYFSGVIERVVLPE